MNKYIIILEKVIDGVRTGVDFYINPPALSKPEVSRVHYWEYSRTGINSSGCYFTISELMTVPRWADFLKKAGAGWFLSILERMHNGEEFSCEQIEALVMQHNQ